MPGKAVLLALLMMTSTQAFAGMMEGTPQEQAACRPDVRRFCHGLGAGASGGDFLGCLQAHRVRLRPVCRAVLESHGQ